MRIALTGSTGFVGVNMKYFLKNKYDLVDINLREISNFKIENDISILIHLAGIAHDLKNTKNDNIYYEINTNLTKKIFDSFLESNAEIFIFLSSIKAVCDKTENIIDESFKCNPQTVYGKSKLLAEEYILSKKLPGKKRFYILRPCMIHGPGNKGNLNLLYKVVSMGLPWPLGAFTNKRSFCSIDNLSFIINELIQNNQIPSGIYNIADDDPLSTNELIRLISESQGKKYFILEIPKFLILIFSKLSELLGLPLNTERLNKLTENYVVSNIKIKQAINKQLPLRSKEGIIKTFNSFNDGQ